MRTIARTFQRTDQFAGDRRDGRLEGVGAGKSLSSSCSTGCSNMVIGRGPCRAPICRCGECSRGSWTFLLCGPEVGRAVYAWQFDEYASDREQTPPVLT